MYLLEMAMNFLLCGFRLFMFCWTRYYTNLKQMLKKIAKIFVTRGLEAFTRMIFFQVLRDIIGFCGKSETR